MLSFNYLGNLGRLGNQMFQYASLKGIAKNNQYDFIIPSKNFFGTVDSNVKKGICIYDCFELSSFNIGITQYETLGESTFGFDKNIYNNCPDNRDLLGYFQCEKYFENIEQEIRKDFTFKNDIIEVSNEIFEQLFENTKVISLHVRRGDYLTNPNHPIQSLEYYQSALSYFDSNLSVIIFSDDPQWCDQQEIFQPDRFFISEEGDTAVDLCLMSMCNYHIIANSSYSWWGSYLAKSEKTVAPINWFGDELKQTKDVSELYRKDWIII